MTSGLIIVGLIVALALWIMSIYNGLVTLRQRTNQSFADVDVQLKQRHDLIPALVETFKGSAAHERETLDAVIRARQAAVAAPNVEQKVAAENGLTSALGRLFALGEAYPDLKANAAFQQLQTELGDVENKLASARRFFNNATQEFNSAVQRFPAVLFASALGFHSLPFFSAGDNRAEMEQAPNIKF